ncbi:DoxX family protein [Streptomyces poriferorum]|uniref:DoxX family protein n=1 Tax=Streptomyces poriferorum TaxID=2798799 RepID=A0ABY9IWF1_9ACTN|nr:MULTISPECIES: DoxX family protein [unclassified Streptomyces]MDP5311264.1 DoxX family protein [Streptomyces sp. Alt4]WLQ47687.1 DoxX family protein [Streptomyces sp. Alt1]WLQ59625.1 DoxX family protein [Streptomyces sp. Alt2]
MSEITTPVSPSAAPASPSAAAGPASASASAATGRRGRGAVALSVSRYVLALFLGFSGIAKLIAHESAIESFDRMGWSHGAMYVIGGLETAGAVALLIPVLAGVAAIAFCGLLAGASVVQLTLLDPPNAVMPAVLVVVMVLIARDRRDGTAALVARVRRGA